MTQWGGVLTVRLTVGFTLVVDPVLLETTQLLSTPMSVKVYELLGVTPFGVVTEVPLLPHAGMRKIAPQITNRAITPQYFLDRFPPAAAPNPASASSGSGIHKP